MAFSISARALKGLAIGALEEEKRHRLAAETRVDEQSKFDRENEARIKAAALQEEGAMAREKYGSDMSYKARIHGARITGKYAVDAARATALLNQEKETYDFNADSLFKNVGMVGRDGSPLKLPASDRVRMKEAARLPVQSTAYFSQFNRTFNKWKQNILGRDFDSPETYEANLKHFRTWVDKEVPNLIVKTAAQSEQFDRKDKLVQVAGSFDLESAAPDVYNYIKMSGKDAFPNSFDAIDTPSLEDQEVTGDVTSVIQTYPDSKLVSNLGRMTNEGKNRTMAAVARSSISPIKFSKSGITEFFSIDSDEEFKKKVVQGVLEGTTVPAYNSLNPTTTLDLIASGASIKYRMTQPRAKGVGGFLKRRRPISQTMSTRLKTFRDKAGESEGILRHISQVRLSNVAVTNSGAFQNNFLRGFERFWTGIVIGLGRGATIGGVEDAQIGILDKEAQAELKILESTISGFDSNIFENMRKTVNDRLRNKLEGKDGIGGILNLKNKDERNSALENYRQEVVYENLKIQLVYKVAKLIQGGSGGQAVSNADFQAVLKAMQSGNAGTLEGEAAIYAKLQEMVEKEYVYNSIMADSSIIHASDEAGKDAMAFLDRFNIEKQERGPRLKGTAPEKSGLVWNGIKYNSKEWHDLSNSDKSIARNFWRQAAGRGI